MLQPYQVLKFVGNTLSIPALISLVTLTFNLSSLKLVCFIVLGVVNLSTNCGFSGNFRYRLMGQKRFDGPSNFCPWNRCALLYMGWATFLPILRPRPLALDVTAIVGDTSLRAQSLYQVWSSQSFPIRRYSTFTAWELISLVTLSFDLLPLNRVSGYLCDGLPSRQFWAYWAFSLWSYSSKDLTDRRMDGQTDTSAQFIMFTSIRGLYKRIIL